eukprot:scaffold374311_cov42-Prasinocladus_malaysianus.AAC.1
MQARVKITSRALQVSTALLLLLASSQSVGGARNVLQLAPGTVVDVVATYRDFTTLAAAVEKTGLATTLTGDGPFTVFGPVNRAFDDV